MDIQTILADFTKTKTISEAVIQSLQSDEVLRIELQNFLRNNPNRAFATTLLEDLMKKRQNNPLKTELEDLMYAAYLLGLHRQIEDCLKIWDCKNLDFDTYCGLDAELMLFAGWETTLNFLRKLPQANAQKAFQYLSELKQSNGVEDLDDYFSVKLIPWFV
ncbi:MAG: hypothetical protein MUE85_02305 [Microscillaceae bacterium]|jgi:hypothetical protein|nr:hypothetical protein [Microscillaceae bacterium]